ncbi:MAG: hypothetical protein LBU51_10740, partial [Bacteroidales bacterium]|nr:hypothetical protein [Bacteroidales bacterium]
QSFTSIIAFYQTYNRRRFIDEKEHLSVLSALTTSLKKEYPLNENVLFLEKRIQIISNTVHEL